MKRFARLASVAFSLAVSFPCLAQWSYPPSKTVDAKDTYFGKTYKDPYRWLEDLKDKAVEAWFKAQADLTDGLLAKIPAAEALAKEGMEPAQRHPAHPLVSGHPRGPSLRFRALNAHVGVYKD